MTERQKLFKEAVKSAEACGGSINDVTLVDLPIDKDLYLGVLTMMDTDKLLSHYKMHIEEENFEQCELIKAEFTRRNITVNIIHGKAK